MQCEAGRERKSASTISNNSEATLQRDNQHSSTDSQPLNTLSPVPFDNNVIHLQTDDNKTFAQCEDYDSDETYLSNTEQPLPSLSLLQPFKN